MTHIYIATAGATKKAYTTLEAAKKYEPEILNQELSWVDFSETYYGMSKNNEIKVKIEEVKILI